MLISTTEPGGNHNRITRMYSQKRYHSLYGNFFAVLQADRKEALYTKSKIKMNQDEKTDC